MLSALKRAFTTLLIPAILISITACPGLVVDNINVILGPDGAVSGAVITLKAIPPVAEDEIADYLWNFGDGTDGTGNPVDHVFNSIGTYQITLRVVLNSGQVLTYTKQLDVALGGAAEIDLQRPAGTTLADGATDDQGLVLMSQDITLTYTVVNLGGEPLTVSNISTSSPSNVLIDPLTTTSFVVPGGGSQTFDVTFNPNSSAPFSFELDIVSDDADGDETNYDITISGTTGEPDIDVQRPAGTSIVDEGTDDQSFATFGNARTTTYTVENTGTFTLDVSDITSTSASNVTVNNISPTSFSVASGNTASFDVTFTPTAAGAFSFELDITSNDDFNEENYDITVSGTGTGPLALVTNRDSGTISVIDTSTDTVLDTPFGGAQPEGIDVTPDGATAYVATSGLSQMEQFDIATLSLTQTTVLANPPTRVAMMPDGSMALFTSASGNSVYAVDLSNFTITVIAVGSDPVDIAITPDGTLAYVTNHIGDSVSVINTSTLSVESTITVGDGPIGIAIDPAGARAYVTNRDDDIVSVIDTATQAVVDMIFIPSGSAIPSEAAVSPDGSVVYVVNAGANSISVIDTTNNTITNTIAVGQGPLDVAFTPDGSKAYVGNSSDNTISVIDTTTESVTGTITVGSFPLSILIFEP